VHCYVLSPSSNHGITVASYFLVGWMGDPSGSTDGYSRVCAFDQDLAVPVLKGVRSAGAFSKLDILPSV